MICGGKDRSVWGNAGTFGISDTNRNKDDSLERTANGSEFINSLTSHSAFQTTRRNEPRLESR